MVSAIDPTVPIYGAPTTGSVRDNFAIAKSEIEALQISVANGPPNIKNLPYAQPDGSPPAGAKTGDLYINGGFLCIVR